MATLTATKCVSTGINPLNTAAAAGGGDEFVNTGKEMLVVKNADGGSHSVTIPRTRTVDGQPAASLVVAVPAGATRLIGPFRPADYNDGEGKVQVTYDGVTDVTVLLIKA